MSSALLQWYNVPKPSAPCGPTTVLSDNLTHYVTQYEYCNPKFLRRLCLMLTNALISLHMKKEVSSDWFYVD